MDNPLTPYGSRENPLAFGTRLGTVPPPTIVSGAMWNNTPLTPNGYREAFGRLFPFGDSIGPHYLREYTN